MKEYDIRDEYELHNLLRKICNKSDYPNIKFKRMPTVEFGIVDRNKQILELLEILAPISNMELSREYENEYGIKYNVISAGLYNNDSEINQINYPEPPQDLIIKLNHIFNSDFYMLDDMRHIYKNEFYDYDEKYFNSYTIKSIGFMVFNNYVVKAIYSSATDYFKKLLLNNDIVDEAAFPNDIRSLQSYYSLLYELKDNYEIIEFSPNKYINIRKLNKNGITKDDIKEYCKSVVEFVPYGKYFTLRSLKNIGFSHKLDELGFDDWFYTSLLLEDNKNFSYLKIGGNKLLFRGIKKIASSEFIEMIIYEQESLSIDIYELINCIQENYDIQIDRYKIPVIVKNTDMYYNCISEKIYANYDVYYEEL